MYAAICLHLIAFFGPVTAMSIEAPVGAAYDMLPSPGAPQHTRIRRQTLTYSSSTTTSTPPPNDGSSAVQGVTMTLQDFVTENSEIGFLLCLQHERDCKLDIDDTLRVLVMNDLLKECGNSFSVHYYDTEFMCKCHDDSVSCDRSPKKGKKRPVCHSFILGICAFLKHSVCHGVTSSTTTTMQHTTSPSSTVQTTTITTHVSTQGIDTRAIEMTTISEGTAVGANSTVGAFEDGNGRLLGGIIGGVAGGVVLTISLILLWSFCRRRMTTSSTGNVTTSDVQIKEDDRRALCDKHSDAASSDYHTYELPDVIGTLPPYATSADLTGPEVGSGDVDEYNRLGDHAKNQNGPTHMYDHLEKTKLNLRQHVINNDYNHTVVEGEVTVDDVSRHDNRLELSDSTGAEAPPYYTIDQEDSGKGLYHKYFVLEKTQETPNTPPYSKLSFD